MNEHADAKSLPELSFREDRQLLIWKPRGVVTEAIVNRIFVELRNREAPAIKSFNRTSEQEGVEPIFKYMFGVSLTDAVK